MRSGLALQSTGALLLAAMICASAAAAEVDVRVLDAAGQPVGDAVVSLHGGTPASSRSPNAPRATARMEQKHSNFAPGVLPVQVGTQVAFPNLDNIQHHVYSFSQPQPFEIPLYSGDGAAPIRFDAPGVVVVGCNIHDWMIGHIVVLDTPHFAKTGEDGSARIDVPPGRYTLRAWHVRGVGTPLSRPLEVPAAGASASLTVSVTPEKQEAQGNDRLRALQEKFRQLKGAP